MKLKYQLSLFNIVSKLLLLLILWFSIPFVIETIIDKKIDKDLLEKKQKFVQNLNKKEIRDFLVANDTSEVFGSFSVLHNEFTQLEQIGKENSSKKDFIFNESRRIENQEAEYRILNHYFTYNTVFYKLEIGSNVNEIQDIKDQIRRVIVLIFLIISLLTFVADTFFVNNLLHPFNKIINTKIRLVHNPEKFNYNSIPTKSSEFKELDSTLNEMMDRITKLFMKEKQFIGNVSHELMTPISILKSRFENLIQNESLNDYAVDKISDSLNTLDSMKKVIQNLLLISRIDNKQYKTDEIIDFQSIMQSLVKSLKDRIQEKNLVVSQNLGQKVNFYGNKTLIQILINNLLTNAIKYNNAFGSIIISDKFINNRYTIKISDTGIGMSEDKVATIFERFTRIHFDQEGHGIGLAIVDSIAHLHGIEIEVVSQVNQGTSFILKFSNDLKA